MKRLIFTGLASLGIVWAAVGATAPAYINDRVQIFPPGVPPVIDATNFINNSAFIDNTFNTLTFSLTPYETANTVNYTNFGVLGALGGFRFDTFNTQTAGYTTAGNVHNEVGAIINCGGTNNGPYFSTNFGFFSGMEALCLARATNIINRGTIDMGVDSLLSLEGQNVILSGGLLNMEGFESGDFSSFVGIFDGYWGLGQTPRFNPVGAFDSFVPSSPAVWVTNREYMDLQVGLSLPLATAYVNPNSFVGPSNYLWQVVFLQNTVPSMSNNVYFGGGSTVEWIWPSTNIITGMAQTNHMFLFDDQIAMPDLALVTNGVAPPSTGYRFTFIPTNYFLFRSGSFFFGTPAAPSVPPLGIFTPNTNNFTSGYTAYEAIFQPTTVMPGELAGQTFTNMPGRIEITASKQLDLRSNRIAGLNYVRLNAPNHFTNDPNTRILTYVADYNLGVTNGTLVVSNLLAPTCPRLNGLVDVFSTRWTNVDDAHITNTYYVLMVDSHVTSSTPSVLQNLTLHATNVVISDVLNVLSNITIDAYNLMITTNGPKAQTPVGQLNFPFGKPLGVGNLPRLRTLTNYGIISVPNTAFFGSPAHPYWYFVNRGSVATEGCSIWATNFENTGVVNGGGGGVNLTATSAVLNGGSFNAPNNDISLDANTLFISNHVLNAGHKLTIRVANSLTDGDPDSGNTWMTGVLGFELPAPVPVGGLLGTTLFDTAPDWAQVVGRWAGEDRGAVAAGYTNNAALGRLILDGGVNSSFELQAPSGQNALYVDYLEFRNFLTNFDAGGNLAYLSIGSGMKLYYAQLIINGVSWAEKLDGKNGGGLNWVPSYAGAFSSTNMLYPDGTTNRLNLALVQACDLDSNCNGLGNCKDPAPLLVSEVSGFAAEIIQSTNVVLSWYGAPLRTNYVEFKTSLTATNWQPLTNVFIPGAQCVPQQVVDVVTNVIPERFYRVRVNARAP